MVKGFMQFGTGAFMLAKEKLASELSGFVEKGVLSSQDMEQFMANVQAKGREEEQAFRQKIKEAIQEIVDEMGLATKQDIDKLREAILQQQK